MRRERRTYQVLVKVRLRLAVGDARHRLVVVELVAQLAEVSRHRDDLLHAYISNTHHHNHQLQTHVNTHRVITFHQSCR